MPTEVIRARHRLGYGEGSAHLTLALALSPTLIAGGAPSRRNGYDRGRA